jgi:preprotein translocase subunit SecA
MLLEDALGLYDEREEELGDELMRALERYLLLQIIDQRWREHLYDMDYLREGIHLRGFAQIEPLVAYKNEAFDLFRDLMNSIWDDYARLIFHVQVTPVPDQNGFPPTQPPQQRRPSGAASSATGGAGRVTYSGGGAPQGAMAIAAAAGGALGAGALEDGMAEEAAPVHVEQRRVAPDEQIGRNDPCWCGSGKKYKKCHGA